GRDAVPVVRLPVVLLPAVAAADERPQHLDIARQHVPDDRTRSCSARSLGRVEGMLKVDADPGEVGLDPDRLRRLDDAFRSYVDDGRLPGWTLAVTRRGKVAHLAHHGLADLDSGRPVGDDTLWRIYSMTKPITSVAAMMLYEEGRFELTDP